MNTDLVMNTIMTTPASGRMTFWVHSKPDRYATTRQRKFVVEKLGYKRTGHATYEKANTTIRSLLEDASLFVQHFRDRPSAARIGNLQIMAMVGAIPLVVDAVDEPPLEDDFVETETPPLKLALAA